MKKDKRYFFVSYSFSNMRGSGFGSLGHVSEDGKIFRREDIKEGVVDADVLTVLWFKELSKEDFEIMFLNQ